jgi:hypothetical protein
METGRVGAHPPVFGPLVSLEEALVILRRGRISTVCPSVMPSSETSSPTRKSSITTTLPASPNW